MVKLHVIPDGSIAHLRATAAAKGGPGHHRDHRCGRSPRLGLARAKIMICGGRALGSANELQKMIEPLADQLGVAVGASGPPPAGYAFINYQVG